MSSLFDLTIKSVYLSKEMPIFDKYGNICEDLLNELNKTDEIYVLYNGFLSKSYSELNKWCINKWCINKFIDNTYIFRKIVVIENSSQTVGFIFRNNKLVRIIIRHNDYIYDDININIGAYFLYIMFNTKCFGRKKIKTNNDNKYLYNISLKYFDKLVLNNEQFICYSYYPIGHLFFNYQINTLRDKMIKEIRITKVNIGKLPTHVKHECILNQK